MVRPEWREIPGCDPTSLCAIAHNSPWGASIILAIGAVLGILAYRVFLAYRVYHGERK
jgi:hypothetical protein